MPFDRPQHNHGPSTGLLFTPKRRHTSNKRSRKRNSSNKCNAGQRKYLWRESRSQLSALETFRCAYRRRHKPRAALPGCLGEQKPERRESGLWASQALQSCAHVHTGSDRALSHWGQAHINGGERRYCTGSSRRTPHKVRLNLLDDITRIAVKARTDGQGSI